MSMLINDKWDYDFKAVNPVDYELMLTLRIDNRMMEYIFQKSIEKLNKEHKGISFKAVKKFRVPDQYMNLIRTAAHKMVQEVDKIIKHDGVRIFTDFVQFAEYEKDIEKDWWIVHISVTGQYQHVKK